MYCMRLKGVGKGSFEPYNQFLVRDPMVLIVVKGHAEEKLLL